MKNFTFRPKNYGQLSRTISETVFNEAQNITQVAVSESTTGSTVIIPVNLEKLLRSAIMGVLMDNRVTNVGSENHDFMNGLNINLEDILISQEHGRLNIHVNRNHETNMHYLEEIKKTLG